MSFDQNAHRRSFLAALGAGAAALLRPMRLLAKAAPVPAAAGLTGFDATGDVARGLR